MAVSRTEGSAAAQLPAVRWSDGLVLFQADG